MKVFGLSDRGAVREENQDSWRYEISGDGGALTAVLCDGMGGAQAGSIASFMAAEAFMSHAANSLDAKSSISDMRVILKDAVNYANIKVYDKSYSDFSCMGMGSTLVAVLINLKKTLIANVGDSRAYFVSKEKIQQISRDHSYVGELLAKGQISAEEALHHPKRNIITRAVGVEASVKCDLFEVKMSEGDRVLLCSDGLSNLVTDSEMLDVLEKSDDGDTACRKLVGLAVSRGAPDNVTIVIAER